MPTIAYRELARRYRLDGPQKTVAHLSEALRAGHLAAEDFSLRDLAEVLVPDGHHWVRNLDPRQEGRVGLAEAGEGVDVTAFLNVTGQVIHSKILAAYEQEGFVFSKLVETISTRLDGERMPGAGRLAGEAPEVHPGMPYPAVGFGEDYIDTPATTKHGLIVPVTREAIFFDRTHLVLARAAQVGEALGMAKEKRLLDLLVGAVNNYRWRGRDYQTYYAPGELVGDGGEAPWANVVPENELVDWTNVDAAEQRMAEIVDPSTGEPVLVRATHVLVMPAYRHAAHRIFRAAEIAYTTGATTTTAANPLTGYRLVDSRLAYHRLLAAGQTADEARKRWFLGDFRRAFAYMQNWPITVTQSPPGSEAEFSQDVVVRFKASERGAAAVLDPRYVVMSTG